MNRHIALTLLAASLVAGCGTTTPVALDDQMGTSVELAKAQQTLNPKASQDTRPVEGIDGKTADALMDRYQKGFENPTSVNIFTIGVGGGAANSTLGPAAGQK
jgi:hypothetical protein